MRVNRDLFIGPFMVLGHLWQCPTCKKSTLASHGKIETGETGESFRSRVEENYGYETYAGRFVAMLKCTNTACQEHVAVSGTFTLEETQFYDEKGDAQADYDNRYTPTRVEPAPHLFSIPKQCPVAVTGQLERAFALYWVDLGAAANAIRAGVEELLTERGVARTAKTKRNTIRPLSLHERIVRFRMKNASAADFLEAIKWLGNIGSHGDEPQPGALLDGFDFFEQAIDSVYVRNQATLAKAAQAVNKRKGKPRKVKAADWDL